MKTTETPVILCLLRNIEERYQAGNYSSVKNAIDFLEGELSTSDSTTKMVVYLFLQNSIKKALRRKDACLISYCTFLLESIRQKQNLAKDIETLEVAFPTLINPFAFKPTAFYPSAFDPFAD